jgi:hypothetical protein
MKINLNFKMLKVIIASLALQSVVMFSAKAATVTSTAAGGNWSTGGTWQGGIAPGTGDAVIIIGPVTSAANVTQTAAGSLTVNNGGSLSVTGGTYTFGSLTINNGGIITMRRRMTILGATNITGRINFGSTNNTVRAMTFTGAVTLNSGAVWDETNGGGNTVQDTYAFSGGITNNAATFTTLGGVHTFRTNAQSISGTTATSIPRVSITGIVLTNNLTLTVGTALGGTGTLTNGATATLNIGGTATITTLNAATTGNTVNYYGTAQTAKVATYYDLTLSGSNAKTFATTPTVNGTLSLEGTANIAITTGVVTYGPNATLQYNKPAAYTATSEEWISPFAASGGIIITNTGAITTNAAKTLSAGVPLTIDAGARLATGATNTWTLTVGGATTVSGTLTLANTANKTFTGDVTINSGGTWNETGIAAIGFGGNLTNDATTFTANTGLHTFSGAAKVLSGSTAIVIPRATFTGDYINNATLTCATALTVTGVTLTNNGTITANTALSGTGGLTNGASGVLNIGGTSVITNLDASTNPGNTVNYIGTGSQTVRAVNYYNLGFSGARTTNSITINGAVGIAGALTNSATFTGAGNFILAVSTITFNGNGAQTIPSLNNVPYVNLALSNGGTKTLGAAVAVNTAFTIGSNVTFDPGSYILSGTGIFTVSGTAIVPGATFATNYTIAGTKTINAGSTFIYNGAAQTVLTSFAYSNLTLSGSNTKTAAGNLTVGGTLNNSVTLDMAANTLNVTGSIINTSGIIKFSGVTNGLAIASGTIEYYGTGQIVTTGTYNNLTISGSGSLTGTGSVVNSDLTINPSASFEINANADLTVIGASSNTGTFNIRATASGMGSFIDNGISSVNANVERWVSTNGSTGRWEYVSSPISSASSSLFTSALHALYYADETINAWVSIPNASPQTLGVMRGYTRKYVLAEGDGNVAKTFTGLLNTGAISIPLTRTETAPGGQHGWNLVGNPYPSTMDWNASSGWTKSNIDNAIYFRTNGNYGSYINGVGTNGGTQYIPPMQAFWVRVSVGQTTGSLACNNSVRIHNSHNIYKNTLDNTLLITVANDTNVLTDQTYVRFDPGATDTFDSQYDAYKMFAADVNYPQVYTNNGTDDISINTLSELTGVRDVPLGFKSSVSGQFTITADMVSSFTNNGNTVYLEDMQTSTIQDLSIDSIYAFTSGVTTGLSRFILHFNHINTTSITEHTNSPIQIYGYNNEVHIKSLNILEGDVAIYDILGQLVATKHLSGINSEVIRLEPKTAVYIVRFTNFGQTITKKIFIK